MAQVKSNESEQATTTPGNGGRQVVDSEVANTTRVPKLADWFQVPPTQLQEPAVGWREGVERWSEERIEAAKLALKRYLYEIWVRSLKPKPDFPPEVMKGSLADLSRVLAGDSEVPSEFIFASSLTIFGGICAENLRVSADVASEPRLYTVLLGKSYTDKKSSALKKAIGFFQPWLNGSGTAPGGLKVEYGVGSAEGLAQDLGNCKRVLLAYDEFSSFFAKAKVESSVLLPMVTSLFEAIDWDNRTKQGAISLRGAHLSMVGCCTLDTYSAMWTSQAIRIGFPNRLFVVWVDRKRKNPWPKPPDPEKLGAIRERITRQIERLPKTFDIAPDARQLWEAWYHDMPESIHAKRLDTIGFRLMAILAFTMDKEAIDLEVTEAVIRILNYELAVRTSVDPVDAENKIAALEEKIRRILAKGPRSRRELRRDTHADRIGLWAFEHALQNLQAAQDIRLDQGQGKFYLIAAAAEASPEVSPGL